MSTVQSTVELINAEKAKAMLETSRYFGQRPLRKWHVDEYAQEMVRGTFRTGQPIQMAYHRGGWVLLDGQHRLHAIIESRTQHELVVIRHFGLTDDGVADMYGVIDRPLIRTPSDDAAAHGMPEKTGLTLERINALSASAEYILNSFHRTTQQNRVSLATRREEAIKYAAPYKRYLSCVKDGPHGPLWGRVPSVSVGIVIFASMNDERADAFWSGMAKDDGLRSGDPRRALITWMSYRSVSGRVLRSGKGFSVSRDSQSRAVATAWNAFYDGRSLSLVKVIDEHAPIVIRGTGYDGKNND